MFKMNEGNLDRGLRIALGLGLVVLGFGGVLEGGLALAVGVVGLIPLATGLVGWCPLYSVLGIDTCGTRKAAR
ncbi:MAG: YgaP family membrane protein [Gemmatimonadota bacterium]